MVFIVELFYFARFFRADWEYLSEPWGWVLTFFISLIGLVVGLILNSAFNFRRAMLLYIIGHVVTLIGTVLYFQSNWKEQRERDEISRRKNINKDLVYFFPDDPELIAFVSKQMLEDYPDRNYQYLTKLSTPKDNDTSGRSGYFHYLEYMRRHNEGCDTLINKYYVGIDTCEAIFKMKKRPSLDYEEFIKQWQNFHENVQPFLK